MRIELLYFDDCPSWATADERLEQVAGTLGLRIERRLITTPEEAEEAGFRGSPTILIDGDDPFAAGEPFGLACRIYQTPDGPAGSPTVEQLTAVIEDRQERLEGLADALVDALRIAGGRLDADQRRTALATYRLLAEGGPVTHGAIAEVTGLAEDTIVGHSTDWPGVFRDANGAIVGFWGLALGPLDPRYALVDHDTGEPVGYAWCAWDTLFLPALLGRTLDITAADGHSGQPITLTAGPDGVRDVTPAATLVSFLAPLEPWGPDILTTFCHEVLFFTDVTTADAWMDDRDRELFALSVQEAFDVGRRWTSERYGDALLPSFANPDV